MCLCLERTFLVVASPDLHTHWIPLPPWSPPWNPPWRLSLLSYMWIALLLEALTALVLHPRRDRRF